MHGSELQQPHRIATPWPKKGDSFPIEITHQLLSKHNNKNNLSPKVAVIYYVENNNNNNELLKSLKNLKENLLIPMKKRNQLIDVFIFSNNNNLDLDLDLIKKQLTNEFYDNNNFILIIINNIQNLNRNIFFGYYMFLDENLKKYDFFLALSVKTNIISPLNWNVFEMFYKYDLFLGFHRWWWDNKLDKNINPDYNNYEYDVINEKLTPKFDKNIILKLRNNYKIENLPPIDFCYHDYLILGSFKFFRENSKYLSISKEILINNDNDISFGCWYVQLLATLENYPVSKIFHLAQIYVNFKQDNYDNDDPLPFSPLNGWPKYHDTPMWRQPNQKFPTIYKSYKIVN